MVITSTRLQQYYNKLYSLLRNYLWEYRTVREICNLELACYKAIPDLNAVRIALRRVRQSSINVIRDDNDLKETFEDFESALQDVTDICVKVHVMKEVL